MTFCSQKRQDGFFWKIWTLVWLGFGKEKFFFGKRHFSEIERLIFFKRSHPAFLRSIIAHSKKKIVATHFHHRVMNRLCFGRQGGPVASGTLQQRAIPARVAGHLRFNSHYQNAMEKRSEAILLRGEPGQGNKCSVYEVDHGRPVASGRLPS